MAVSLHACDTAGLRTSKLESIGYDVSSSEFTSLKHTQKNIMIKAIAGRSEGSPKVKKQQRNILLSFPHITLNRPSTGRFDRAESFHRCPALIHPALGVCLGFLPLRQFLKHISLHFPTHEKIQFGSYSFLLGGNATKPLDKPFHLLLKFLLSLR